MVKDRLVATMDPYVGTLVARSIVDVAANNGNVSLEALEDGDAEKLCMAIEQGVKAFIADQLRREQCCRDVRGVLLTTAAAAADTTVCATRPADIATGETVVVRIDGEYDIVIARGQSKTLCATLGFAPSAQVKIATVVSELARNIVQYVGAGRIELTTVDQPRPGIEIRAIDKGQGIDNLDVIMSGRYKSKTGMGMGLYGTSKLMDEFDVVSTPTAGTQVTTRKYA